MKFNALRTITSANSPYYRGIFLEHYEIIYL
jgi:hypothetical protein